MTIGRGVHSMEIRNRRCNPPISLTFFLTALALGGSKTYLGTHAIISPRDSSPLGLFSRQGARDSCSLLFTPVQYMGN